MWTAKQGIDLSRLRPEIARLEEPISDCFAAFGVKCIVTSANDGKHKAGSFHYKDSAVDLRTHHLSPLQQLSLRACVANHLAALFPGLYDVIIECSGDPNEHLHVECSPKLASAMFPKETV